MNLFRALGLLVLLSASSLLITVKEVHASGTLYAGPHRVNQQSVGAKFKIQIKVADINPFNAWDIEVRTNATVLNATSFSIFPNLFRNYTVPAQNFSESIHCINGIGFGCGNSTDGPGIVHSGLTLLQNPPQTTPSNGLLFTINYQVVSGFDYSPIEILNDTIANDATTPNVTHVTVNGIYGIPPNSPNFTVSSDPSSLNIAQGSAKNSTVTIASVNSFNGTVTLKTTQTISGMTIALKQPTLNLKSGGTNTTTLMVSAAPSLQALSYAVTLTANTSFIHHDIIVPVAITPASPVKIEFTPAQIFVHAGASGNVTVTVTSPLAYGYYGAISLSASVSSAISPIAGVETSLNPANVHLARGGTAYSTLTVSLPVSQSRFSYTIRVTGIGASVPSFQELIVMPPAGDLSVTINPSPISVEVGGSVTATINVASLDYLWGTVNLAANMTNGVTQLSKTALIFSPSLSPDNFNVTLRITIDRATLPGTYALTLTVYTSCFTPSGQANNCRTEDSLRHAKNLGVIVFPTSQVPSTPQPTSRTILGIAPPLYFGVLGVFALLLVVLCVQTYRRDSTRWPNRPRF